MKKKIAKFLIFASLLGCDTETIEYLFNENDPEYAALQTLAQEECVNDSQIFGILEGTNEFSSGTFNQEEIYKITQDANPLRTIFIKITAISATSMTLVLNSDTDGEDKVITYEESDNSALIDLFKAAACHPTKGEKFSPSGLNSTDSLILTWTKQTVLKVDTDNDTDDDPDGYKNRTEAFTIDKDYPMLFHFFNATKTEVARADYNTTETNNKSVITITKLTDSDADGSFEDETLCTDSPTICTFGTAGLPTCSVTVNSDPFTSTNASTNFFSYPEAGCTMIPSGT